MEAINSQRINEIYQEILNKANQRGQGWTWYSQYEATKMRAMADVWKKYAEAGDNPALLAEAKRFEAQTIYDLELKNIQNQKMNGVSDVSTNQELKEAQQRHDQMLAQVNLMRGGSNVGSSDGPKFGEEGWWDKFNKHLRGLIGQGPRTGAPDGIPEQSGGNNGKLGMNFGYWATMFYMGFNSIMDGSGNYLAHPELVPGIPETGQNEEALGFGPWYGPTGGIDAALMDWEKMKNQNSNP